MTVRAFIGMGSNLGDREAWCRAAGERLTRLPGTRVVRVSPLLETAAAEGAEGGPFLNGVTEIETDLSPRELLRELRAIEVALGRSAEHPRGDARTIDLDLLLYGGLHLEEPGLVIPHPRMAARRFVLQPLASLAPDVRHPLLQLTASELLRRLEETAVPSREAGS
jgi:2-amino-4-hydroxy-6-hydroxymethyldihydropteridine diphosphokinase